MKVNLDNPSEEVQIQIVPLIDVIFCILTFFILAALQLTRQQGINLDLPKAGTANVQMRDTLVITIDPIGQTFADKQPVDRAQLYQVVKAYHDQNPEGLLVLQASQTALYNDVIQVLDIMRAVGGNQVALATAPVPTPGASPGIPGQPTQPFPVNPGLQPSPGLNPTLPGSPGFPGANPVPDNLQQIPGAAPGSSPALPGAFPGGTSPLPGQTNPAPAGTAPNVPQQPQ
jgi:biopolymer transport protein ExbD